MRAKDNNTLDLNTFPDDPAINISPYSEEGSSSSSSSVRVLKEKQAKEEKEYECRFCSLKFFKSQALGGHMNRHRQERETESLKKARELVLRNDSFPPHQGPSSFTGYHHQGDVHMGEVIKPFKPMIHPSRLFSISGVSSPPLVQPYLYPPTHSSFPHHHTNNYFLGNNDTLHQTLTNSVNGDRAPSSDSSYTFIGAPVLDNGSRAAPSRHLPLPPHHGLYSKK